LNATWIISKGNCIRTPAAVQLRIMPTAEDIPCR
jgi:hypothetical protein